MFFYLRKLFVGTRPVRQALDLQKKNRNNEVDSEKQFEISFRYGVGYGGTGVTCRPCHRDGSLNLSIILYNISPVLSTLSRIAISGLDFSFLFLFSLCSFTGYWQFNNEVV